MSQNAKFIIGSKEFEFPIKKGSVGPSVIDVSKLYAQTDHEKKSLEVAANASLAKSLSYRIYENGKALRELTTKHGVILEDTPSDYFTEYMAAAKASLNKNAADNAFFNEVYTSMKNFADIAVPFWSGAQMSNAKLGMAHAATLK